MEDGDLLEIIADDLAFESDIKAWCSTTGNEMISMNADGDIITACIKIISIIEEQER